MTALADLRSAVARLEELYAHAEERLATRIRSDPAYATYRPADFIDGNGRYLLLESMRTIVEAKGTIARYGG